MDSKKKETKINESNKLSDYFINRPNFHHFVMLFILQTTIYFASYHIVTFSFQKRRPEAICIRRNSTEPASLCTDSNFCDYINYEQNILYNTSLNNWALKYKLYCENDIYLSYLNSIMFVSLFISGMVMTPLSNSFGRLVIFRIEITLVLVGNAIIYFSESYVLLFLGTIICFLGNHITFLSMIYLFENFKKDIIELNISFITNLLYSCLGFIIASYIRYSNDLKWGFIFVLFIMSVNFYLGWKIMIETPIWLEKTDKKNSFKQLIKNFIFLENFDDDENKEIIIEEFKFKIDQIIQNEETIKKKEIKLEESQLINENKELKQPGKFRLKNFLIAVYLWIFNQVIFYLLLLNLDKLENHIPYSI